MTSDFNAPHALLISLCILVGGCQNSSSEGLLDPVDATIDTTAEPGDTGQDAGACPRGRGRFFADPEPMCESQAQVDCFESSFLGGTETCDGARECNLCWFLKTIQCVSYAEDAPCRPQYNCMVTCVNAVCGATDDACRGSAVFRPEGQCYSHYRDIRQCMSVALSDGLCVNAGDVCVLPNNTLDAGTDGAAWTDAGADANRD